MSKIKLRYKIRKKKDRVAIKKIGKSTGFFTKKEIKLSLEVFDECVSDSHSGYYFVFAEIGKRMVGYASWGKDEQTFNSFELYWIAVDDSYRNCGIGKLLIEDVEASIRKLGAAQLFIETSGREVYEPTRYFYEHRGYAQSAWLSDYYSPGDALVIYSKRL
ncbi:MAG: GNAT family N-acetyltransferase [Proteobacteria bacterium]|nr:GNAT family N-acetyltransferase [Pseudomonadota bacterium]